MSARTTTQQSSGEESQAAIQNVENFFENYDAVISPATRRPMVQLKKFGECTLTDPRACMHHYQCAADTACILYAHVSIFYFHYMVHSGYISNKTRMVLNDTINDTFVFVVVESTRSAGSGGMNSVDDIIRNIQRQHGHCRPGVEVLQAGSPGRPGYIFSQPKSVPRKDRAQAPSNRVLDRRDWMKRLRNEKSQHDCQRRLHNDRQRQDLLGPCRNQTNAKDPTWHYPIPMLVVEAPFDIKKDSAK